jgi:steroid 5-alpha reductase family enzyme
MSRTDLAAIAALPVVVLAGAGLAWAGSHHGASVHGVPVFGAGVAIAFLIQWLAFLPAWLRQTERFYDLVGSSTYVVVSFTAASLGPALDGRAVLLLVLVAIWAARLGAFLFLRVMRAGQDSRFDEIKASFPRFLLAWTLQGLWVAFTLAAALVALTALARRPLGWWALAGSVIWAAGFTIEAVADNQKRRFRADPRNHGRFIRTGLWAWSRHPNYLGEIVLWIGIAVIALPVFRGWQWVALASPLFVTLLLLKVSGLPPLERRADERWGG